MVAEERNFTPKDGFVVCTGHKLYESQLEVVLKLYQPLVGTASFSLYALLRTMVQSDLQLSNRKMHSELFDLLDIGLQTFYEARCKLEAIGLLRTFEQNDELGRLVIYELQEPQEPANFFADDLLRSLLLETVGERIFKELRAYFFFAPIETKEAVETTKHFLEVYTVQPETLSEGKNLVATEHPLLSKVNAIQNSNLDEEFLKQLIGHSFIDSRQVFDNYQRLTAANAVYGFDELALLSLLEEAANVATSQVDFTLFWKLVHEKFAKQDSKAMLDINPDITAKKAVNKKQKILKSEDQELLAASRAYAPAEFLQELKREKGSFVTGSERNIIEWVVQKNFFQAEIINILIHYMIVDRGMATLNRAFFEAVIADWSQKKISTPEEAMLQVRTFNAPKKESSKYAQTQRYSGNKRVVQKEKLPDWAKNELVSEGKSTLSQEEQAQLKKRLSRFKKKID
ncbi:MAG: DnaD domain protein [Liquorilactobacillus sp.]|uniref:DnaD domain protein n=1 Tax=Liquorilactobacillus sp. TaxID=2767923 RepID=UPI0039E86DD7